MSIPTDKDILTRQVTLEISTGDLLRWSDALTLVDQAFSCWEKLAEFLKFEDDDSSPSQWLAVKSDEIVVESARLHHVSTGDPIILCSFVGDNNRRENLGELFPDVFPEFPPQAFEGFVFIVVPRRENLDPDAQSVSATAVYPPGLPEYPWGKRFAKDHPDFIDAVVAAASA